MPRFLGTNRWPVVTTLPATGTEGQVVYNTTDDKYYGWDDQNANWVDLGVTSVGSGSVADVPMIARVTSAGSYTFSGLNGDVDEAYELVVVGQFNTAVGSWAQVRFNGVTTGYSNVFQFAADSTSQGVNNPATQGCAFVPPNLNRPVNATLRIAAKSGRRRSVRGSVFYGEGVPIEGAVAGSWSDTAANVQSLEVNFDGNTFTGVLMLRKLLAPSTVISGPRIVRGVVNGDGSIASGSGFTVTKNGTGLYTITYATQFSQKPAVAMLAAGALCDYWDQAGNVPGNYTNRLMVRVYSAQATLLDREFSFEATDTTSSAVDNNSSTPIVTAFPTTPVPDQEILIPWNPGKNNVSSGQEILLHCRYDAAKAGNYKWRVLNAPPYVGFNWSGTQKPVDNSNTNHNFWNWFDSLRTDLKGIYQLEGEWYSFSGNPAGAMYSAPFYNNAVDYSKNVAWGNGVFVNAVNEIVVTTVTGTNAGVITYSHGFAGGGTNNYFQHKQLSLTPKWVGP